MREHLPEEWTGASQSEEGAELSSSYRSHCSYCVRSSGSDSGGQPSHRPRERVRLGDAERLRQLTRPVLDAFRYRNDAAGQLQPLAAGHRVTPNSLQMACRGGHGSLSLSRLFRQRLRWRAAIHVSTSIPGLLFELGSAARSIRIRVSRVLVHWGCRFESVSRPGLTGGRRRAQSRPMQLPRWWRSSYPAG